MPFFVERNKASVFCKGLDKTRVGQNWSTLIVAKDHIHISEKVTTTARVRGRSTAGGSSGGSGPIGAVRVFITAAYSLRTTALVLRTTAVTVAILTAAALPGTAVVMIAVGLSATATGLSGTASTLSAAASTLTCTAAVLTAAASALTTSTRRLRISALIVSLCEGHIERTQT